jgi:catechol-2,3-dioxygenase
MSLKSYDVGGIVLPRPFHVQRLGHIGLTQQDLAGGAEFFCDGLGFRKTDMMAIPGLDRPAAWFTSFGADHHSLVHVDAMLEAQSPHYARGVTVNQISFQVGTLKEVADANAYFAENGIETWRYGRDFPGSNWAVYAFDPDGFRVELYYGMEQIGWDRRSKPAQYYQPGYVPSLPEPAEFTEIANIEAAHPELGAGFRPAETMAFDHVVGGVKLARPFAINKIGPVHLFVDDIDASEAFYTRHVGLVRTEEVIWNGHPVRFLRHGTDHHSIGLFPIAIRAELGLDPRTRLMSIGVELGSYRQLADAVAWLRGRGVAVVTDRPADLRPGIDHAAFVTDPNGHMAMLYCGIEQIGWDGRPRAAADRRAVAADWPETLAPMSDTYLSLTRQGPMA